MRHETAILNQMNAFKTRSRRAFTLVEMMITMTIFSMVVTALVYAHMFGLRQNQLVQSKCGASASARRGFGLFERDIRSCKIWEIGNATASGNDVSFTSIALGSLQWGNAVKISLTTDTSKYILYYFDTTDPNNAVLYRRRSDEAASTTIAANLYSSSFFPTNSLNFTAEDYSGAIRTDRAHKNIIHTILEFRQFQYPTTTVGSNSLYDYYKLEFRLTPHVPD